MTTKYTPSKTPSSHESKPIRVLDHETSIPRGLKESIRRIPSNQVTVERIYGELHPNFGGSLGAGYDKSSGAIDKTHRASAVGSLQASTPSVIEWDFSEFQEVGLAITIAYAFNGAYLPIVANSVGVYTISDTFPTDWTNVVDPNGMFATPPAAGVSSDIAIINGSFTNPIFIPTLRVNDQVLQLQDFSGVSWVTADVNHQFIFPPLSSSQSALYTEIFSIGTHVFRP